MGEGDGSRLPQSTELHQRHLLPLRRTRYGPQPLESRKSHVFQLVKIGFFESNIALEFLLFTGVGGVGERAPASFDALDVPAETFTPGKFCFDARYAAMDNAVAGRLGGDNLYAGKGLPVSTVAWKWS